MTETIDPFAGPFKVNGMEGVAWRAIQYKQVGDFVDNCEGEEYYVGTKDDTDWVMAYMIGDDRAHEIEVSEITMIDEDSYCGSCGQIGCGHG